MPSRYRPEPDWKRPLAESDIGRRVWALRLAWQRSVSPARHMADFVAATGVGKTTLDDIERGKTKSPDSDTVAAIAKVTGAPSQLIYEGVVATTAERPPPSPDLLRQMINASAEAMASAEPGAHDRLVDVAVRYLTSSGYIVSTGNGRPPEQ